MKQQTRRARPMPKKPSARRDDPELVRAREEKRRLRLTLQAQRDLVSLTTRLYQAIERADDRLRRLAEFIAKRAVQSRFRDEREELPDAEPIGAEG